MKYLLMVRINNSDVWHIKYCESAADVESEYKVLVNGNVCGEVEVYKKWGVGYDRVYHN